jgi:hypothetical protein
MAEQTRGNPPEPGAGTGGDSGATGRFGRTKEFVGEKYAATADSIKDKYSAAREKVEEIDFKAMTEQVREYVRANPGKALLISVGAGFLLGLLLRRGDRDED